MTRKRVLVEAEMENVLARFVAYCEWGRSAPRSGRRNLAPDTAASYAHHLRRFFRHVGSLQPMEADAREYVEWLLYECRAVRSGEAVRPTTGRMAVYAIRTLFEYRKTPLSDDALDEARALLEGTENVRDHAILTTLLYSGIRASECAALRVRDFYGAASLLRVPARGFDGNAGAKGAKAREVVIHARCVETLRAYLAERPNASGEEPLFASHRRGLPLSARAVSDVVREWSARTLSRRVSAHLLRHTFAVHAADDSNGKAPMPLRRIQEQLGHATVTTTLR